MPRNKPHAFFDTLNRNHRFSTSVSPDERSGPAAPPRPWHLRLAAHCFHGGGLIAYPTEAVYGLGCDPLDAAAVQRLLALKRRPVDKGLILIAAEFAQLAPYVEALPVPAMRKILDSWPGPTTWLLPAGPRTPAWLTGRHPTLAVRVTAHPLAAALCRSCGSAVVSTSANISDHPPARTALGIYTRFGKRLDYVLHGPVGPLDRPTSIRDALSGRLIRA